METPEPDSMAEAIAAMRREWAEIEERVMSKPDPEMDEEDQAEANATRARLLEEFLARHKEAIIAANPDPAKCDPAKLEELRRDLRQSAETVQKAEDQLLQTTADLAEADAMLTIALLDTLRSLEELSDAEWDAMEPEQRKTTWEALEELRGRREEMLESLPLEERRKWEG